MALKMQKLGAATQETLKLAACIGNQYELETLAVVHEKSPQETAADLWPAIADGLILPLSDAYKLVELDVQGLAEAVKVEYKFAHDRIQQAAYSLIPERDKLSAHWKVGQLLLSHTPLQQREQKIFDIVNQLNAGRQLIHQPTQRNELAQLNLIAGKKAKASAAYQAALKYLQLGLSLLDKNCWKQQYDLSLKLHIEAAEAAYLNDDFEQTEELAIMVRNHAKTVLNKVKVYQVWVRAYCNNNHQLWKSIEIGLEILEQLGIALPKTPSQLNIEQAIEQTKEDWAETNPSELIDLPLMKEPEKLAAIGILSELIHPTFEASPKLYCLVVLSMVDLSVRYGNTALSALAYSTYGCILSGVVLDFDSAYQFGQLALNLVERLNAKSLKACVLFFVNAWTICWKKPIREVLKPLQESYQLGMETGDLQFGCMGAYNYCYHAYWMGMELTTLERDLAKYSQAMAQINQEHIQSYQDRYWQVVLNLMGKSDNPCRVIGQVYDEEKMLPIITSAGDIYSLYEYYLHKFILSYLFYEFNEALENASLAEEKVEGATGTIMVASFYFYDSLLRLAVFPESSESEQQHILGKISVNQEKMKLWAEHAPMNFLHKFYLVEAERARILGKYGEAREYYDKAIDLAQENKFLNEEALANELAGKFYLTRDQNRLAQLYLQNAHYTYQRWGAVAKAKDLEARYPQFFAATSSRSKAGTKTTSG
jgi:predicted ATPase